LTNIIVHGLVSNKYITQGYHAGAVTGGDSSRYYYMQPQQLKRDKKELFLQIKNLLQALKGD